MTTRFAGQSPRRSLFHRDYAFLLLGLLLGGSLVTTIIYGFAGRAASSRVLATLVIIVTPVYGVVHICSSDSALSSRKARPVLLVYCRSNVRGKIVQSGNKSSNDSPSPIVDPVMLSLSTAPVWDSYRRNSPGTTSNASLSESETTEAWAADTASGVPFNATA